MDKKDILNELQIIYRELDGNRVKTAYTANEGMVKARKAILLLNKLKPDSDEELVSLIVSTISELNKAIDIGEIYNKTFDFKTNKQSNMSLNPWESIIMTHSAIGGFIHVLNEKHLG